MRVVIAGGSGFIGRRLARRLADRGDHVVVLTRNPDRPADPGITWAPYTDGSLDADAVGPINRLENNYGTDCT